VPPLFSNGVYSSSYRIRPLAIRSVTRHTRSIIHLPPSSPTQVHARICVTALTPAARHAGGTQFTYTPERSKAEFTPRWFTLIKTDSPAITLLLACNKTTVGLRRKQWEQPIKKGSISFYFWQNVNFWWRGQAALIICSQIMRRHCTAGDGACVHLTQFVVGVTLKCLPMKNPPGER